MSNRDQVEATFKKVGAKQVLFAGGFVSVTFDGIAAVQLANKAAEMMRRAGMVDVEVVASPCEDGEVFANGFAH